MKSNGFTLLELLIATIILMSALTTAQLIYRNYVDTDQRFSADTRVYSALLDMVSEVRKQLNSDTLSGNVRRGDVQCQFDAEQIEKVRPQVRVSGALTWAPGTRQYEWLKVSLSCEHKGIAVEVPPFHHTRARYVNEL